MEEEDEEDEEMKKEEKRELRGSGKKCGGSVLGEFMFHITTVCSMKVTFDSRRRTAKEK